MQQQRSPLRYARLTAYAVVALHFACQKPATPGTATPETPKAEISTSDSPTQAAAENVPADAGLSQVALIGFENLRYADVHVVGALERSVVAAVGEKEGLVLTQLLKRVLVWWVKVPREIHRGDRIEFLYRFVEGEAFPVIEAIWFHSNQLEQTKVALRYQKKDAPFAQWFDQHGEEIEPRLEQSPIREYEQITALIGDERRHHGVDFKAPVGTPLYAPFDGTVVRRNWRSRGNGNCLELRAKGSSVHAKLLHLDSILPDIKPGKRIKQGDLVAHSGDTGRSTAPHLHYQLERGRQILDPFKIHKTYKARLAEEEHTRLKEVLGVLSERRNVPAT